MKLKNGDRIRSEDSIYTVKAVLWSTVYLSATDTNTGRYDYDIKEIYKYYRDIEFLGKMGE